MDKISVNKLVEEVKSNLPREILVVIAQSCLNENMDSLATIKNFEKEVYKYTFKVQTYDEPKPKAVKEKPATKKKTKK